MPLVAVFLSRVTGSAGSGPRTEANTIKRMTSLRERENTSSVGSPVEPPAVSHTDTPYYAAVSLLSLQTNLWQSDSYQDKPLHAHFAIQPFFSLARRQ